MDLEVLSHLIDSGAIEGDAAIGIAKRLLSCNGDLTALSPKQLLVFQAKIKPFIEDVDCRGVVGPGTCIDWGKIAESDLLHAYLDGRMLCSQCQYLHDKNLSP